MPPTLASTPHTAPKDTFVDTHSCSHAGTRSRARPRVPAAVCVLVDATRKPHAPHAHAPTEIVLRRRPQLPWRTKQRLVATGKVRLAASVGCSSAQARIAIHAHGHSQAHAHARGHVVRTRWRSQSPLHMLRSHARTLTHSRSHTIIFLHTIPHALCRWWREKGPHCARGHR